MAAQEDRDAAAAPFEATRQPGPPQLDSSAPYDTSELSGKTILITGGASGFGAAFARKWASHGAHITIGDINDAAGEELVAELRSSSGNPHHHYQRCDVTDWQSQVALFQTAARLSPTGGIDVVVPNAGIVDNGDTATGRAFENPIDLDAEAPPPPRLKVLDVNLTGVMYSVHLALFWLPRNTPPPPKPDGEQANGHAAPTNGNVPTQPQSQWPWRDRHILFISSVAGIIPLVGTAQYTASKHAVTGLFRSLRGTVFRQGIRVNMLCPYFVDTPLLPNGALIGLAGAKLAELEDVVDAATRFMADRRIAGRSVVIGPRVKVEDDGGEGEGGMRLVEIPREGERVGSTAVWECYAHDYENVEMFVFRYVRLLRAIAEVRGWVGWVRDIVWILFFRKTGRK